LVELCVHIDSIPARQMRLGVESSHVLERIASVAWAPWKKEEGSMVKLCWGVCLFASHCWRNCDVESCGQ